MPDAVTSSVVGSIASRLGRLATPGPSRSAIPQACDDTITVGPIFTDGDFERSLCYVRIKFRKSAISERYNRVDANWSDQAIIRDLGKVRRS